MSVREIATGALLTFKDSHIIFPKLDTILQYSQLYNSIWSVHKYSTIYFTLIY